MVKAMFSNAPTSLSIRLENVAKKFGSNWIFKNVNLEFVQGKQYAIIGRNGSGKSTLLKVIGGLMSPNNVRVSYSVNNKQGDISELYHQISFCAPYMELPEELTMVELLRFHQNLRPLSITNQSLAAALELEENKEIRNFSSGM